MIYKEQNYSYKVATNTDFLIGGHCDMTLYYRVAALGRLRARALECHILPEAKWELISSMHQKTQGGSLDLCSLGSPTDSLVWD